MHLSKIMKFFPFILLLLFSSFSQLSAEEEYQIVSRFTKDTIFKYDSGNNLHYFKRWEEDVDVYLRFENENIEIQKQIENTIHDINSALVETKVQFKLSNVIVGEDKDKKNKDKKIKASIKNSMEDKVMVIN